MRPALPVAAVLVALGLPRVARAEDPPPRADTVYLHGGRTLRGTLLESDRRSIYRIRDASGQVWTVPSSDVDHVGSACTVPASPPDASSRVRVHVDSPVHVGLQQRVHDEWQTVCTSPCDTWLPRDASYRFGGDGLRPTSSVSFQEMGACADVQFTPASPAWFATGIVLTAVSVPLTLGGAFLFVVGAFGAGNGGGSSMENVGVAVLLLGLASLPVGIAATAQNFHSDLAVTGENGNVEEASRTWLRTASFRDAPPVERALPVARVFPVFQASF